MYRFFDLPTMHNLLITDRKRLNLDRIKREQYVAMVNYLESTKQVNNETSPIRDCPGGMLSWSSQPEPSDLWRSLHYYICLDDDSLIDAMKGRYSRKSVRDLCLVGLYMRLGVRCEITGKWSVIAACEPVDTSEYEQHHSL